MRDTAKSGVVAAFCLAFVLGAFALFAFTLANRADSGDFFVLPGWISVDDEPTVVDAPKTVYLVRPEAPEKGVNIVKDVHQRAPATDAEAAGWLSAGEMVTVEPGTAVKRISGEAPGYAVSVEVLNGPREGLRGWVWEDTLREQWP